jgi:hypothetical protein
MHYRVMRFPAYLKPENGAVGRAFGAWLDHAAAGVANRFVLVWFVILYTAFAIISSAPLGLHPELLETYALSLHPAAGYVGQAPLAPLIAAAWFRLLPATEWAFHLLAMVNAAVGLFAAGRIARQYLTGDKQIAVLLFLLATPFYSLMGQGFGAAETMLSTWPIATWCFLRSLAARNLAWPAAAGATAAVAVLGSWHSVFLLAGFAAAVLAHPGRRTFLRSWAPWLMAAAGAIVLAPYARWLIATLLERERTGVEIPLFIAGTPFMDPLTHHVLTVAGVGVMLAAWSIAVRPGRTTLRDTVWPLDADGRTLVILLAAPLALPALAAGAAPWSLPWLPPFWPAAAWFLVPVILLRPKAAALSRTAAIRIAALAAVAAVAALAAAPWLAWLRHGEGTAEGREYYRLVGAEVTRAWRLATGQPLQIVAGDPALRLAVAFYSPDHPDPWPGADAGGAPPSTGLRGLRRPARDGFAAVCRADDEICVAAAKAQAAGKADVQFITYSTTNRYLGKPGRLGRFFFILAPPGDKPVIMLR